MVKISELKMNKVRKVIPFLDANGDKQKITIYNATQSTKESLIKLIEQNTNEEGETLVNGVDMLTKLFPLFTDLEIDVDNIDSIVSNPSKEIVLINSEILTIVNEVQMEILLNQSLEYEKLLLLSEQVKGLNMLSYIRERMSRMTAKRDFDPLNSKAKEERNEIETEEMRQSYEAMKKVYEDAIEQDKIEKEKEEKEVEIDG